MKTTLEIEKRILILYAVQILGNRQKKKDVLNYLKKEDIIKLDAHDLEILSSRSEERWRNDLAFVRYHLVKDGYISNLEKGYWTVTKKGEEYYRYEVKRIDRNRLSRINKFDILTLI